MIFYYPAICKIFVEHLPNRTANNNKTKRFILQFGINSDFEKHKYTNYYAKPLILQKPTGGITRFWLIGIFNIFVVKDFKVK